jgi:hypothetical protein
VTDYDGYLCYRITDGTVTRTDVRGAAARSSIHGLHANEDWPVAGGDSERKWFTSRLGANTQFLMKVGIIRAYVH